MITIALLEGDDFIDPEDWCRPLSIVPMSGGHSDFYSFESMYTGAPENNAQWVKAREVFGDLWYGQPVKALNKGLEVKYEFVRGILPLSHTMMSKRELEAIQASKDEKIDLVPITFGKHKGKTPQWILTNDRSYLEWLADHVPTAVSKTMMSKLR
jgi:hypothetical protein